MIETIQLGTTQAILVDDDSGHRFLMHPIVLGRDGRIVDDSAARVLQAIVDSKGYTRSPVSLPIAYNANESDVAKIQADVMRMSERLGIPIGPPSL